MLNFEKEFHVFQFSQILLKICAHKGLGIKLCRESKKLETGLGSQKLSWYQNTVKISEFEHSKERGFVEKNS